MVLIEFILSNGISGKKIASELMEKRLMNNEVVVRLTAG
jgi:hypothetical protein